MAEPATNGSAKREKAMMKKTTVLLAMAAVGMMMLPAVATAQSMPGAGPTPMTGETADDVEDVPEEQLREDDRPWSVSGSVSMRMGQGIMASPSNDTQWEGEVHDGSGAFNRVSMSFGISPSYQWRDFAFSGQIGYQQYLSAGGGIIEPYEGRFQDIELSGGHEGWSHDGTGISVQPSFRATLPTSSSSRAQTRILGTGAGLGISRTFLDEFMLSYSLSGSRSFHRYTSPVMDIDEIGEDNALFRTDGTESIDPTRFAVAGINTKWGLSQSLSAGLMLSSRVMAMVNWSLSTSWSYDVVDTDEFSSEHECEGGRCSSQSSMGMLMVNYIINENMGLNIGLSTAQGARTSDNKSRAFPFYNFTSPASNRTNLSVGLMGSY